jgi:DNA-binding XRE family transcriptional regulator
MYKYILPTPEDIIGARAYLKLSQGEFAKRAGIAKKTLFNIENRKYEPSHEMLEKVQKMFLSEGIMFLQEGGFKANQNTFRALEGKVGIKEFYDDLIATLAENNGGVVSTSGVTEVEFLSRMTKLDLLEYYRYGMSQIENVTLRILDAEGLEPPSYIEDYVEARVVPHELYMPFPCYVYYDKLGFLLLHVERAFIIKDQFLADEYRYRYDLIWNHPKVKPVRKEPIEKWHKYLKNYEDKLKSS